MDDFLTPCTLDNSSLVVSMVLPKLVFEPVSVHWLCWISCSSFLALWFALISFTLEATVVALSFKPVGINS